MQQARFSGQMSLKIFAELLKMRLCSFALVLVMLGTIFAQLGLYYQATSGR